MSFPRYPAYKPSGVAWLGEVPEHWEALRLRFAVTLNPSKQEAKELGDQEVFSFLPMEAIGEDGSLRLEHEKPVAECLSGYTYFRDGDVCVAKITPCFENGKGAILRKLKGGIGFGTTELIVARPEKEKITSKFLDYVFRSQTFRRLGESEMYGAGGQKRVPESFIRDFTAILPSVEEQIQITIFLDRETAKFDALIAEQQRLIELLQEKRQAVISHAVTKGLNPDAPMKDSGVEWLGEVPEHWEVGALSYALVAVGDVDHYMPENAQEGVPYVMTGDLKDLASQIDFEGCKQVADQDYKRLSRKIKTSMGDLIMARYATIGTVTYVDVERKFLVSYSCVTIKPDAAKADGRYLFFCLKSDSFFEGIRQRVNANTQENIGIGDLKKVKVVLPPLNEQLEIAKHLQAQASEMEGVIKASQDTVRLLKERRSALISAAVTGQIDVRGLVPEVDQPQGLQPPTTAANI